MKTSKLIWIGVGLVVGLILYLIMRESLSQPGLERFEGKYEEIAFFRNENNTGPVVRVMAIRALDSDQAWMRDFAEAQPHTKYGRTLVFFFSADLNEEIQLSPQEPHFPERFQPYLIARFEKTPMGEGRFSTAAP